MADESAGTGVAELDRALGGLYWGDNVVWVWEGGAVSSQGAFYNAIARRRDLPKRVSDALCRCGDATPVAATVAD